LLLCDALTGARIGQVRARTSAASFEALAAEVRALLTRFPQGVQSAVVVPDLISRDLRLEHVALKKSLAELLREALSHQRGLAVVELEEAKAIAGEHALTGGEIRRIVPLFAEGEYRTEPLAPGGPRLSISVTLKMAQRDSLKVESGSIPIDRAGRFMLQTVEPKLLESLKSPAATRFDAKEEFGRLVTRANQFAEIGDFSRSAELREAALLLEPEADAERVRLVRDYSAANDDPMEAWPKGARQTADDPFWSHIVSRSRELWRHSLYHVEYLVRNRRVEIKVATELLRSSLHSIALIRGIEAARLKEEEQLKKDFLRSVSPALMQLPGKNGQPPSLDERSGATWCIYENTFLRMDGNYLAEDDLVLAGDLLCDYCRKMRRFPGKCFTRCVPGRECTEMPGWTSARKRG
jgi:hypothetical protein